MPSVITDPTWSQVETAPTQLGFIRALTRFALTAPTGDFPSAMDAVSHWPQETRNPPPSLPFLFNNTPGGMEKRRIDRANRVIAHAFTTRATETAIRYHASLPADAAARFRPGFFTALTALDPARAHAELLKIPAGPDRQAAAQISVTALAPKDPAAALALVKEMGVTDPVIVFTALRHLATAHPLQALASVADLPENCRDDAPSDILITWYQTAPDDAVAWLNHNIPVGQRPPLFEKMFGRFGRDNFARALEWEKSSDPVIRAAATKAIENQLGSQPISVAWDRILSKGWDRVPLGTGRFDFLKVSLGTLLQFAAAQPLEEIRQAFRNIPQGSFKDPYNVHQIVSLWTLHDPEGALAWAGKIPDAVIRHDALLRINPLLTETDPKLAFAQIDATPPGPFRVELVQATIKALAQKDITGALDWTLTLPAGPEKAEAVESLVQIGSDYDPAACVAAFLKLPAGPASDSVMQPFVDQWIQRDTAAALDWFTRLPAGPLREKLRSSTADFAARFEPDRAFSLAQTLPAGPERSAFIQALADNQAAGRPEEVLVLVNTLPPSSGRRFAQESVLRSVMKENPSAAVALFETGALGPSTPKLIERVAVEWADLSPADSARWLAAQLKAQDNDSLLVFSGVAQVAKKYAAQDPEAALAWAAGLADPQASRRASGSVINQMAERYPERAWQAVIALSPTYKSVLPVLEKINRQNPATARRLLDASALPDDVKAQLQSVSLRP
ncbi:MAG: hypothetical protein WC661_19775 [Opitutaceae bacterium]|jgi:hypothetical protein